MKSKPSYLPSYTPLCLVAMICVSSLALNNLSTATVIATPIRFGSSGDSDQEWNTSTANDTSTTYTHTINGVAGTIETIPFLDNDKADFTLTVNSTGGNVATDTSNKLGVGDGYINTGESLKLSLSVSVDSGYRLKALYIDQIVLDGWGSGDSVKFSDQNSPTGDVTYSGTDDPTFRYDGTPSATHSEGYVTWRPLQGTITSLGDLTDLTPDNVGGEGDGTWELTMTGMGGTFYLNEVHIHYEVELIPEPTTTSLLGLSGLAFLLRRKRK